MRGFAAAGVWARGLATTVWYGTELYIESVGQGSCALPNGCTADRAEDFLDLSRIFSRAEEIRIKEQND